MHFPPLQLVLALSGLAFSTPAIRSKFVWSFLFHPCYSFPGCQALRFSLMPFVLPLSGPGFATTAITAFSSCQVSRFSVFPIQSHNLLEVDIDIMYPPTTCSMLTYVINHLFHVDYLVQVHLYSLTTCSNLTCKWTCIVTLFLQS